MKKVNNRFRNYTVSVPLELANEITKIAKENGVLEIEVLRKFLQLGLLATMGDTPLYFQKDGVFVELELFPEPKAEETPKPVTA